MTTPKQDTTTPKVVTTTTQKVVTTTTQSIVTTPKIVPSESTVLTTTVLTPLTNATEPPTTIWDAIKGKLIFYLGIPCVVLYSITTQTVFMLYELPRSMPQHRSE